MQIKKLHVIRGFTILLLGASSYIFSAKFYRESLEEWEALAISIPLAVLVYIMFEALGAHFVGYERRGSAVLAALVVGTGIFTAMDFSQGNYVINTGRERKLQSRELTDQAKLDTSASWIAYRNKNIADSKKFESRISALNNELEVLSKRERSARWRKSQGDDTAITELSLLQVRMSNITQSRLEAEKALAGLIKALDEEKQRRESQLLDRQDNLRQAGFSGIGAGLLHVPALMIVTIALVMAVYAASEAKSTVPQEPKTDHVPIVSVQPVLDVVGAHEHDFDDIAKSSALSLIDFLVMIKSGQCRQKDVAEKFGMQPYQISRLYDKVERLADEIKSKTGRNGTATFRSAAQDILAKSQN